MTPPTSSARALHDILARVLELSQGESIHNAWQETTGHPPPSADFARFHAATTALLSETVEDIARLHPSRQDRHLKYLPAWWLAVVRPRYDWATQGANVPPLIASSDLDHLAAAADAIEDHVALAGGGNPQAVEVMGRAVDYLQGLVREATDIPPQVRDQIITDLAHITWLLQSVGVFGVEHATRAFEATTAKVGAAAARTPSVGLKRLWAAFVTALVLVSAPLEAASSVVENVTSLFGLEQGDKIVQSTVVEVHQTCVQKAITATPTQAADGDTVVDAEIVEEDGER